MPIDVLVPPLSATTDTLLLVEWYRQEGETVTKDEPLFAVETDKATLDVEAPASGTLRQVSAQPGDEVVALSRLAVIAAPGETWAAPGETVGVECLVLGVGSGEVKDGHAFAGPTPNTQDLTPIGKSVVPTGREDRLFISPRARRLAESRGTDWRMLHGTGPEGAIVERDVQAFLQL